MTGDAFEQVAALLVEREGIDRDAIHPQSRLLHDLGLWGDDAVEFFDAVAGRFGTDLSALRRDWARYFAPEGYSWRQAALSLPVLIVVASAVGFGSALIGLPQPWAALLGTSLAFGALWLLSHLTRGPELEPLTVADIAAAVACGRWEPAA